MNRRQRTVQGLVLSRRNTGEADRLITFFTHQEGVVRASARGVRKLSSRRGRHLEPLTEITAVLTGSGGALYVAAAETVEYFPALHRDDDALARAQTAAGGVLALFGEHDPQPGLYVLLHTFWAQLPQLSAGRRPMAELATILELLHAAGVAPRLGSCRICQYAGMNRHASLEPGSGSYVCADCVPPAALWHLSPLALKAARLAAARQRAASVVVVPAAAAEEIVAPWRMYLSWHMTSGQAVR